VLFSDNDDGDQQAVIENVYSQAIMIIKTTIIDSRIHVIATPPPVQMLLLLLLLLHVLQ